MLIEKLESNMTRDLGTSNSTRMFIHHLFSLKFQPPKIIIVIM